MIQETQKNYAPRVYGVYGVCECLMRVHITWPTWDNDYSGDSASAGMEEGLFNVSASSTVYLPVIYLQESQQKLMLFLSL